MKTKRILSLLLAVVTIFSTLAGLSFVSASAATVEIAETGADYGLANNIQDGNILHCFNWKYNDIKAELKNIAEAGFTSVQTSPAQPAGSGEWYWLYQPYSFNVGSNSLGSKSDLQSLCSEAEKYGIKVVVDVVANHLNGETHRCQQDLQDSQYWHSMGGVSSWADRYQVTHGEIGMRDLNSEHSYVQQVVANYMKELEGIGVDGIRWDAAKHIALPSEGCNFWKAVTSNNSMWHYGEILVGPADGGGHEGLMKEYTNYMSVTDSIYGMDVRNSFAGGNAPSAYGNWATRGIAANKLVLWAESHDTYSNGPDDWGASTNIDQNKIDRAYAFVASREGSNALYFSRPSARDKGSIHSGQKGSTSFKNKEVAAVNQLKNACVGEKDYVTTGNNCSVVCRESGAVIIAGGGSNMSVNVPNGGGTTKPGTYKDLVSGSTWTVTSSNISGQIGQSGIAVLLNKEVKPAGPVASVSPASQNYMTETLELTLSFENATSGQYSINGGAYQSFTNGQKITIGKGTAAGTKTTISVKATNGSQTSDVETYTYNQAVPANAGIYCDTNGTNWSSVDCYIYTNGQGYKEWPGEKMTDMGNGIWYYKVPAGFENCQVIFSDGGSNQYPSDEGLKYSGNAMIYIDDQWKEYAIPAPDIDNSATVATQAPVTQATQATQATLPIKPTETAPVVTDPTEAPVVTQAPQPTQGDEPVFTIPPIADLPNNKPQITTSVIITEGDKYLYGDLDLDGRISIKDATLMQKGLAKLSTLTTLQLILSDVNASKKVSIADVSTIQKYCANISTSFESGTWYTTPGSSVVVTEVVENTVADPTEAPVYTQAPTTKATQPATQATIATQAPAPVVTEAPAPVVTEAPTPVVTEAPVLPTETAPTEPEVDNYIYLKSTWSSVNCHSWPSGGEGTTWPGTAMESLGNGIFRIQLPEGHNNVVFNGDGQQTDDISVQGTGMIWDGSWQPYSNSNNSNNNNNNDVTISGEYVYVRDNNNWGSVNCHSWSDGGDTTTWPGTPMESMGSGLYRIKLPDGHNKVVFNGGGQQTGDLNAEKGKVYNNATGQWENA